jgi:outer membrane immunogenic protein
VAGLLAAPAIAADFPVKAAVRAPVAPAFGWTGCYVGANAGYGWSAGNSSYHDDPNTTGDAINRLPTPPFTLIYVPAPHAGGSGGLGGVGAGCNWQARQWVFGIEGDFDGADYSGSGDTAASAGPLGQVQISPVAFTNNPGLGTASEQVALRWLSTIRGRVGFLVQDRLLLYVTGGLAVGDVHSQGSVNAFSPGVLVASWGGSSSATKAGYVIGAGGEWAFAGPWSVKLEYLWYDLGNISHPLNCTFATFGCGVAPLFVYPTIGTATASVQGSIVRAGINFKFD